VGMKEMKVRVYGRWTIALTWVGKGSKGRDSGGDLTNVQ
jgi:hypothetical protein